MRAFSSNRMLAAVLVGGASLALYLLTLAPTITWANAGTDGGDLITAAATLGVPHPPGYPLYITLGHLFAQLPIGDVAFRLNLFSAVCMALAAALITWGVPPTPTLPRSQTTANRGGSILAGLAFAAAPMVWGQATITEVHALNALLVAAILALLAPIVFRGNSISSRRLSVACFVGGLSLTHQLTALALAPLFFSAVRRSLIPRHSSLVTHHSSSRSIPVGLVTHHAPRITQYVFLFLLPLTLYFLLIARAAAQPPINWLGAPTPENFGALITAELYRGYAFGLPLSEYPARLIALAQLLVAQFGWIGVGLIGVGLYRVRRQIFVPALSVALYVIFALSYNTVDSDLYLIPVWIFCAYAIAAGAQALTDQVSRTTQHVVRSIVLLLIPGLSLISNFATHDLHADRTAEQFAQKVLAAAPAEAVIITHLDAHTFTLWYYRHVQTQRPDVAVIDARLAAYPWYDPMLRAQNAWRAEHAALNIVEFDPETTWLDRLRDANPTRPVCDLDVATEELHCP
ncbi:MAG: DUF2723 domain-containing protein [Thermoflexales bacterium]|nr:DUF2723 domain-containing protein [Thermoflexales bacterium]